MTVDVDIKNIQIRSNGKNENIKESFVPVKLIIAAKNCESLYHDKRY